jgi:glutamate 5-kinase
MSSFNFRPEIPDITTIVVKVGSRILTSDENVSADRRVRQLVDSIVRLKRAGIRTLLVSSGAIAHGMRALGLEKRPKSIPMKQACASIGQIRLMNMYDELFAKYDIHVGQVLLTWDDLRNKKRYLNLRNTFFHLLDSGVVPIINENDSVGVEEIKFGENDTLAAQISLLVKADVFVNLTDINGLYDKNPGTDNTARHIPVVPELTPAIMKYASGNGTEISVGGMLTKLKAAETVTKAGICAVIGDGFNSSLIDVLKKGNAATVFLPSNRIMDSRHRWIAFTGKKEGVIYIDDGAVRAIVDKGRSLLPAGIKKISGTFVTGDMVDVCDESRNVVARGIVNYSSDEISKISGRRTSEIRTLLGQKMFDEIIHRDNMAVI